MFSQSLMVVQRVVVLSIASTLGLVMSSSCRAGFMLSMSLDGTTPTFTLALGEQSTEIPVYLLQTGGEGRLNSIGLFAAGATVAFPTSGQNAQYLVGSGRVLSQWADTVASSAKFDSPSNTLRLQGLMTNTALKASAGSNAVQIGAFRVAAGSSLGITTLTLSLQGLVADPILLDDFTEITTSAPSASNRVTFGSLNIETISAVPEPSTLLLLTPLALCRALIRRKRDSQS